MKVLFLEQQPCIRALKYAQGLKNTNEKIELIFAYMSKSLTEFYGHGDELFEKTLKLNETEDLSRQIARIIEKENIDLIHSHNFPDYLTVAAVEAANKKVPVIHDIHDLISIRQTPYGLYKPDDPKVLQTEKQAITEANAVICVSSGIESIINEKYDLENKPVLVFPSFALSAFVPTNFKPKLSESDNQIHIVYEGH